MDTEVDSLDRYLICNYILSDTTMERVKADVKSFMSDREKDESYFKFITWKRKENEIAVLTMYAYDDIQLPKHFDTVFQVDKPNNFVHLDFAITQAVVNGWTLLNQIIKGHKHICIIQFNESVPEIFKLLPLFDSTDTLQNVIQLGFCDKTDFKIVKTNL